MRTHRRILLATDMSARSDRAMCRAAILAAERGAELFVVHVLEPSEDLLTAHRARFSPTSARERIIEMARRDLSSDLRDGGSQVTIRIEEGNPADVVLRVAKAEGCDVIVTGVARKETFGRFSLGQTVDALLRAAEVPLLVVTERARQAYQKIMVATDFSDVSRYALEVTTALFPGQRLTVFHAYYAPSAYRASSAESRQAQLRQWAHEDYITFLETVNLSAEARSQLSVLLELGDPDDLLRELAHAGSVDLVVLGTRRRGILLQALLGSVAKRIIATLPCDALVVSTPNLLESQPQERR